MIVHVFNSSIVSGPETLVIPALPFLGEKVVVIFLSETRLGAKSDQPPAYSRSFGLETQEIQVRSRWDREAVKELRKTLNNLSPRVVHAHEVKSSAYVAAASESDPKKRSYRLVTTNHGVRAKKAPVLRLYEWIFTHIVMKKFDQVLTVCTSDRTLLIERGIPAGKVTTHLNGVSRPKQVLALREEESCLIRKNWKLDELGVSAKAICIGMVGRLAPEKRHTFVLNVFNEAKKIQPSLNIHLVIFGTGPLEAGLKKQTHDLKLTSFVHWMGYRGTVGSEMAGFDVLISLSSAEGLPINIVEAGWAGTAVLATALDGNLDLIPSPEFGTTVSLEESATEVAIKLLKLVSSSADMKKTGQNLQNRVETLFSGQVWLDRLKSIYNF